MKQTAVEWLATYLKGITSLNCDEVINQAKEMEKEQIINAAADHCYPTCELATIDAEQYYKEIYGGNK